MMAWGSLGCLEEPCFRRENMAVLVEGSELELTLTCGWQRRKYAVVHGKSSGTRRMRGGKRMAVLKKTWWCLGSVRGKGALF